MGDTIIETDENETVTERAATAEAEPARTSEVKVVDKRRFARLLGFGSSQGAAEAVDPPGERLPTYVEELKQRAERAAEQARAEVEAARARLERHYESRLATARADLAASLLDVFDNLERALEVPDAAESPLYEGVAATRDVFLKRLAELGVEPIDAVGEPFDPEVHEAVDEVPVDDPALDGHVVAELQRGFRSGERLVRPAIVRVGRAS
jgi:molecular chaperone GrpE